MKRSEILQVAKPILFNTPMTRAILDGRKIVTRRVIKPQPWCDYPRDCGCLSWNYGKVSGSCPSHCVSTPKPPYAPGDYLYVRETWRVLSAHRYEADARIVYRAGGDDLTIRFPYGNTDNINRDEYDRFIEKWYQNGNWHPSIHMPKEAARIFLRVTDVRVERLQEITEEEARAEGCHGIFAGDGSSVGSGWEKAPIDEFAEIWDSTVKPVDRDKYGWAANPFVWVISFERVEVTE